MKRFFYLVITFLFFIPILNLKAIDSEDVNYSVNKYIVDARIEIGGSLFVREFIEVEGSYNGYIRDIYYANKKLGNFSGKLKDLEGSSIYNGSSVKVSRVGLIKGNIKFDNLSDDNFLKSNLVAFKEDKNIKSGSKEKYEVKSIDGASEVKLFNETKKGVTTFFLEYTVTNVLVEHLDSAEFYYTYMNDFDDVKNVAIVTRLPEVPKELFKVWGHGQLDASIKMYKETGVVLTEVNNFKSGNIIDNRILFDKDMFEININESKKSNLNAIDKIIEIETKRSDDANRERKTARILVYSMYVVDTLYIMVLLYFFTRIYLKYDKEYKPDFNLKYYREFIDEYEVSIVEYILKRSASTNAFNATVMDLIYKKKISVSEVSDNKKKKDYKLNLVDEKHFSDIEGIVIKTLFKGKKEITLKEIKKNAKEESVSNEFYSEFMNFCTLVKNKGRNLDFYEVNTSIKVKYALFGILSFIPGFVSLYLGINIVLCVVIILLGIIFIIYVLAFTRKTYKGIEHYHKWRAFKKFLEDFGTFEDKELPEIILWERYLVYATVFGIADKVNKVMELKIKSINPNYNTNTSFLDFMVYSRIYSDINRSVSSSVSSSISAVRVAQSNDSSGSGGGGGFSSSGGFGGGGGGGRGF